MDSEKGAQATTRVDDPTPKGHVPLKYMGTAADKIDMSTLGREQVLRVRNLCTLFSIVSSSE